MPVQEPCPFLDRGEFSVQAATILGILTASVRSERQQSCLDRSSMMQQVGDSRNLAGGDTRDCQKP
jgi:hypothetical protein